jgi:DNA-binding MarR family transcriptional regulator
MEPKISPLTAHAGFWLRFVSNHVSQSFAAKLVSSGVTVAEWVILREMYDAGIIAPSALARSTGLTRGAVSKLVDRLCAKRLVARAEAAGDRRYQDIQLTPSGRQLVPKLAAIADANDKQFFAALPATELDRLLKTLKKLVTANRLNTIPIE